MKQSCTVHRGEIAAASSRTLPLVDVTVDLRAELSELVVRSGLAVLTAMLEEDRTALCGPRYAHDPARRASRAGTTGSEVVLGGRKVTISRPRVRTATGHEVGLPTFERLAATDPLDRRTVDQMLLGVATRGYARSLEPLPTDVPTRGTSKSAVSRRFVLMTRKGLRAWQARPLDDLALAVLLIDGVQIGRRCVVAALGIAEDGTKHVLGVWDGSTETTAVCQALLADLQHRGLRTDHSVLVVLDGSKALRKAVRTAFGARALVQRCQVHKVRNVLDHLPEGQRPGVKAVFHRAYRSDVAAGTRLLKDLARRLDEPHPGAAESVREGLEETLTVCGLGLSATLRRTLATTNAIENLIGGTRQRQRNVKRWRSGSMVLRWTVAAIQEAARGFHRIKGHAELPTLIAVLRRRDQQLDGGLETAIVA